VNLRRRVAAGSNQPSSEGGTAINRERTIDTLQELWVWNSNQVVESRSGFGAKTVKIEYSTDGTTWTPLANVPEFARASGKAGYTANTIISFAGAPAPFMLSA
jgi:hypothetical protein